METVQIETKSDKETEKNGTRDFGEKVKIKNRFYFTKKLIFILILKAISFRVETKENPFEKRLIRRKDKLCN